MKKKRIIGVVLACLATLSLSSCILKNKDLGIGSDLSYTFTEENWQEMKNQMTRFENALNGNSDLDLVGSWNTLNRDVEALATYRTIENINYYEKNSDEAFDKYMALQEKLTEVMKWMDKMYQPMYDSKWKSQFFEGMTEEEIQKLLDSAKSDRYYELELENETIIKKYNDLSDTEVRTKVQDIYKSLVTNYVEQAKESGYDNYLEFVYENVYSRDYTVADSETFSNYVKEYIVPFFFDVATKLEDSVDKLSYSDRNELNELLTNSYYQNRTLLDEYASFIGGDFKSSYDFLGKEGYIRLGSSKQESLEGAFTTYLYMESLNQPIMYFGPNNQDTFTFIHEFGHYNSYKINGAEEFSYDLAETQSQGDELLFLAWLMDNDKYSSNALEYLGLAKIYESCEYIILSTIVNDFEVAVYKNPTMESTKYDDLYKKIMNEFGGYDKLMNEIYGSYYSSSNFTDYWKRTCVENPGYYISYAISSVPVLELYSKALDNLSNGVKTYKTIYKNENYKQNEFISIIKDAGLYSPFDDDAYELIKNLA